MSEGRPHWTGARPRTYHVPFSGRYTAKVAGRVDHGAATARAAFTRPYWKSAPVPGMRSAVASMRATTAALLVPYPLAQTSAATPLTCGAAIDVPLLFS